MDEDGEYFPTTVGNLMPCRLCGRTFNPDTLSRHEGICQKNASKRRKAFDSQKQRAVPDPGQGPKRSGRAKEVNSSKSNWRLKHEEFIQTVRAARGVTKAIKEGRELPPPPPASINPDYVQCSHCMRRFNKHAAERHIKFCADQHKRLETRSKVKTDATMKAAAKQERRNTYRPPLPSSGLRRTMNLSSGSPGYSSSASPQGRGQHKSSRWNTGMTERSNTDIMKKRDNSTFDTTLPASMVATTKTGLKARILTNNSSSDIESYDRDISKRSQGRRNPRTTSSKPSDHQGYYEPTVKTRSSRDKPSSYTSANGNRNFDASREASNSGIRQRSVEYKNTGHSSPQYVGAQQHSDLSRAHEDSLSDFVAREFGSKQRNAAKSHYNGFGTLETSPFDDYTKEDRYGGQGEPSHIVSKGTSSYTSTQGSRGGAEVKTSRFCHECGTRYPVSTAKFCCDCGMKRIVI